MTGYIRKDLTNNIADGNVINATDLDNEFDGIQAAFVVATGHTHDGTATEGAAITKIGPVQDVVVSIASMYPKITNTVDLGTSSLKYKDAFFAGNETVGGTLAVTGVATLTAQPVLSSLTASQAVFTDASKGLVSNAITGTGNVVMSTSPTLVTPVLGTPASGTVTNLTGTASININGTVGATTANTGAFTTLTTSSTVTLNGGVANGVAYLNGSKVLTSGTALTFDGTIANNTGAAPVFRSTITGGTYYTSLGPDGIYSFGTDLYLYAPSGKFISYYANAAEQMRLTSTGLGVGTSSFSGYRLNVVAAFASGLGGAYVEAGEFNKPVLILNHTNASVSANLFQVQKAGSGVMTLDASGNLLVGTTSLTSGARVDIRGANANDLTDLSSQLLSLFDTTSYAQNVGAGISFGYKFNAGGSFIQRGAVIKVVKENATDGNYASALIFGTTGNAVSTTEKMRLDSSGNLGLGVTPSAWFSTWKGFQIGASGSLSSRSDVFGTILSNNAFINSAGNNAYIGTGAAAQYSLIGNEHRWYNAPSGTAGNPITLTQAMTLDASGNLGVGTTSPDTGSGAKLTVKGIYVDEGGSDAGYGWQIVSTSSGASPLQMIAPAITFSTGANLGRSERARIDASGNLLVGTTVTDPIGSRVNGFAWFQPTPALRIRTTGTQVNLAIAGTSGTNIQFFTDNGSAAVAAGNITSNGTATSYNTSSDYRLKNITGPITTSGAYIDSLKPVEGTWKADGSTFVGLIAHETQEASRTPVATGTKDGDEMQGMDYSSAEIIANLIAEIQDLRARVSALEPTGFVQSLFS